MLTLRKAENRGHANHGWLDSYHTFSFAGYYDPEHMGFRSLRVINEDRVDPGHGFGSHPHRDMEIISYVVEGALAHQDSTGGSSTIQAGEVQVMSAGTGILHSEFNPSKTDRVHFLQIWLLPDRKGVTPGYSQQLFSNEEKQGTWRLIASPEGRDASLTIHQDVDLYATRLQTGDRLEKSLRHRYAWVQIIKGGGLLNGQLLEAGDGIALNEIDSVILEANSDLEALLFDLA